MEEMFDPKTDAEQAAALERLKEALNNSGDATQRIIEDNALKNDGGEDFVSDEDFHAGDLSKDQIAAAKEFLEKNGDVIVPNPQMNLDFTL